MTMRGTAMGFLMSMLVARPGDAVRAETTETNLLLATAVEAAVRDNPSVASLRSRWEAMLERPAQAGALVNPMLTYGAMDKAGGGTWPDTGEKRIMIQQEFSGAGKRALREGIAAKDAEAVRQELEAMTRDVVLSVKESYFELYAVQQVIALARDEEAVIRRVEKAAETLYATGERPQADVLRAMTDIAMLKQKLLEAQARESTIMAKLNMLLNRTADGPSFKAVLPPQNEFDGAVESLMALAVSNRPEIRASQVRIERTDLEKQLMAKESQPDYRLGLEYRDLGAGEDMVMFTVGVDLPVWRSKTGAGVREAEKMRTAGGAERDAARRQVAFDVREAFAGLQAARRVLSLYRSEFMPQAEARFAASESGYRTGKVDFMDLMESERLRIGARMMMATSEGAVGVQMARLERAIGAPLPVAAGTAGGEK